MRASAAPVWLQRSSCRARGWCARFNAIKWTDLTNEGNHPGEKYAIPLAGDDAEALRVAQRLVRDAGFDPVVVGGLAQREAVRRGHAPCT